MDEGRFSRGVYDGQQAHGGQLNTTDHQEVNIKAPIRHCLTPDTMTTDSKENKMTSVGEDVEKSQHFCTFGGVVQ